jgi:DNA-binding MarR family transcriptional regulator
MIDKKASMAEVLRRTRPFRSPAHEGTILLIRTADSLLKSLSQVVEPHGITLKQFNVLRILRGAGAEGIPTLAIGERMIERSPGVTRLMDRLEKDGWALRERGCEDRRQVMARITPKGNALLEALDPKVAAAEEAAFSVLETDRQRDLVALLEQVRLHLEA